jgi:mRNA interferase RelE/StbE
MAYKVTLSPQAMKDLKHFNSPVFLRIEAGLKQLKENPFTHATRKLYSSKNTFRYRVGDYRILFEFFPKNSEVIVYRIAHRKEAYR